MKICSTVGCGQPSHGRGFCKRHYGEWRRKNVLALQPSPVPGYKNYISWYVVQWAKKHPEKKRIHNQRVKARRKEALQKFQEQDESERVLRRRSSYLRDQEASRQQSWRAALKRKFGMTEEDYKKILHQQGEHCGLCPCMEKPRRRLPVDHDHQTERVRGILCPSCNRLVGEVERVDEISEERLAAIRQWISRGKS